MAVKLAAFVPKAEMLPDPERVRFGAGVLIAEF